MRLLLFKSTDCPVLNNDELDIGRILVATVHNRMTTMDVDHHDEYDKGLLHSVNAHIPLFRRPPRNVWCFFSGLSSKLFLLILLLHTPTRPLSCGVCDFAGASQQLSLQQPALLDNPILWLLPRSLVANALSTATDYWDDT